jgi:hypothetical protein
MLLCHLLFNIPLPPLLHQLFIYFEKAKDSVSREVFYSILTEFDIPVKLVRLIKMCLNKTCNKVCIGKNMFDAFCI